MQNVVGPTLVAMATKCWQIWAIFAACMADICLSQLGGRPGGATLVAMATKFGLGTEI